MPTYFVPKIMHQNIAIILQQYQFYQLICVQFAIIFDLSVVPVDAVGSADGRDQLPGVAVSRVALDGWDDDPRSRAAGGVDAVKEGLGHVTYLRPVGDLESFFFN